MSSVIKICMGSSCFARGNMQNLPIIQQYLKDNNLDATVELTGLRCCDKCSIGPNISIDDESYDNVDRGTLKVILDKHFGERN